MTSPFVVINVACTPLRKTVAAAAADHPDAGVLFHAPDTAPERFDTEAAASDAIDRTLGWAAARGYDWCREDYQVLLLEAWEDDLAARSRSKKKKAAPPARRPGRAAAAATPSPETSLWP